MPDSLQLYRQADAELARLSGIDAANPAQLQSDLDLLLRIVAHLRAIAVAIRPTNGEITAGASSPAGTVRAYAVEDVASIASTHGGGGGGGALSLISQAAAEAGTETTARSVSGLRLKQAFDAYLSAWLGAAPGALNTLDELAAALGDDANFAATVTTALAGKQPAMIRVSSEEIAAGSGTALRSYSPADVTAQVRAQQVHWTPLSYAIFDTTTVVELSGLFPPLTLLESSGGGTLPGVRLLGRFPLLNDVSLSNELFNNAAQDALFIDVARNATEFNIPLGNLYIGNNPGTPTSASQAARDALTALGWTLTFPVPGDVSINATGGNTGLLSLSLNLLGNFDSVEVREAPGGSGAWGSPYSYTSGTDISGPPGQFYDFQARVVWYGVAGAWSTTVTASFGPE